MKLWIIINLFLYLIVKCRTQVDEMTTPSAAADLAYPFGIANVSKSDGCQCTNLTRDGELGCTCRGESVTEVPTNLDQGLMQLSIISASIEVLRKGSLESYSMSLRDFLLESVKKFRVIQPGAFSKLPLLRTIYIKQAPMLTFIPDGVFHGYLPNFKILVIIQSALEVVPNMHHLHTKQIISMIDFDSNRIRNLSTMSVKVRAEIMNLDFNAIEIIEDWAFHGSNIAKLSLKGNRKLKTIEDDAFNGLQNLRKLDLSETAITKLPTKGLEELEVLKLVDTVTLKVFPSVYHFKYIKEAYLTYHYHCCAFKFPDTHAPQEYAKYKKLKEDTQRKYCSHATTTVNPSENVTKENSLFYNIQKLYRKLRSSNDASKDSPISDNAYGHFIYTLSGNITSHRSVEVLKDIFSGAPKARPDEIKGKNYDDTEIGIFYPTTVSLPPETQIQAFCGNLAKNYRDVRCYPAPDAFNPCEDVMGNVGLRVAVWFVLIAAVLGNLAVMIVLMSTRFTMSVSKFLMCNLAFADLCMGFYLLIIASMDVYTIGVYFNYAIDWQHGSGCKVAGFLTVFASELSIFTLTVITLERWYAITYAIHLNKRLRLGMAAKIMICGWIYAITMASLPLLGISDYAKTSICLPMENKTRSDLTYLTTLLTINGLAFLLICQCYGKMYLSITRQQSRATANDKTVAKRMAMLVFTDFACWAPIAFFGLTAIAGYPLINVTKSKILLVFFYPLNSCANPFLYAILTRQYRRDFFILLSRYGLCTKRAMRYKGTYTCNRGIRTGTLCLQRGRGDRKCRGDDGPVYDDGTRSVSSTIDMLPEIDGSSCEVVRLGSVRKPGDNCRQLSIVSEDSGPSSEEESSSPLHKGSPHPIKNSCTKLNIHSLEQEEILKRVLGECDQKKYFTSNEVIITNRILPLENGGFIPSRDSSETKI